MYVSIIIPYKKYIQYLSECLVSITAQTFSDYEVIIAYHESSKNELKNIKMEFSFDNIQFLNCGDSTVASARNEALKIARGKYICFLDSDDYLMPNTLEHWVEDIEQFSADILYAKVEHAWIKYKDFLNKYKIDNNVSSDKFQSKVLNKETTFESSFQFESKNLAGKLYNRHYLNKNNFKFDENLLLYSELPFVLGTLDKANIIIGNTADVYVKRQHNDPINKPSLSQQTEPKRHEEMGNAYLATLIILGENSIIKHWLDNDLLNYYHREAILSLAKGEFIENQEQTFAVFRAAILKIRKRILRELKISRKIEIKSLLDGDINKAIKKAKLRTQFNELLRAVKGRATLKRYIYEKVFLKLKVQNNVVIYESFLGKNYSDSPKYIYQYLLTQKEGYKHVWIINDLKTTIPGDVKKVKRFSVGYFYYMARAKYIINNMRQPKWIKKRKETIFLETWHGTPLKKLVFDMEDVHSASPLYKQEFYHQSRAWDYLVAANEYSADVFNSAFMYEREKILVEGYPRNDILYSPNKENTILEIKRKLNLPLDKKVILYAPTWRDDDYYGRGKYKFQLRLDLERFKKEFGSDYIILLRTHYFIADALDISAVESFAYNASKYDDIAELYLISDILITDYSSVFFDYANLKRPILFFTYDLEKYRDVLRGFYIDMEKDIPGPLLMTNDELISTIKNIDKVTEDYKNQYNKFYSRFCSIDDGEATKRIVEKVFS